MQAETLTRICNPYTGELLRLSGDQLVGISSGQRFPIIQGIPSIMQSSAQPRRNRFYRWLYDRFAFAYDATVRFGSHINYGTEEQVRKDYIVDLEIPQDAWVLESAVGTASNFEYLPKHARFFGVDISLAMLLRAQRKLAALDRQAELFHADAQFLPFHDDTFDLVFSMGGIQFFGDPFKAVSEMARVAKPGAQVHVLDEASRATTTLKRMPAHARYANDPQTALETITRLAPHYITDAQVKLLPSGQFYALTFTKP
ncbi:MAG: class I SAM-dependent methyltransferase [Chloroflexi bacterium]|nr:MAG: class I SAM-dependent methyltransferase [Chloroflexota bacterium]MBL1194039.1 class I SAM-dependent methyltransferase [Chloroflexota bacterium]NOH11333.1 methyltransferase domain-containing protein [Chloroflexota bacterium]